jgi:prophage regulatory protein
MLKSIEPTKKRRTAHPTTEDRNITLAEVIQITGRSRSSVLRDIEAGRLPQPFKFPTGRLYWRLSEVRACLDSQARRVA